MQYWKWSAIFHISFTSLISSGYIPQTISSCPTYKKEYFSGVSWALDTSATPPLQGYGASMQAEHGHQEGQAAQFHFKSAFPVLPKASLGPFVYTMGFISSAHHIIQLPAYCTDTFWGTTVFIEQCKWWQKCIFCLKAVPFVLFSSSIQSPN